MNAMVLYIDGGCSGNDQRDLAKRRMVMVVTDAAGTVVSEHAAPGGSNNIAELQAARDALAHAVAAGVPHVEVRTDSRNNFAWVLGRKVGNKINDRETVVALKCEIEALRARVGLTLAWVPRDENKAGHYIERQYGL